MPGTPSPVELVAALHGAPRRWPTERTEKLEKRYADRLD
jgi:hypothetical protein